MNFLTPLLLANNEDFSLVYLNKKSEIKDNSEISQPLMHISNDLIDSLAFAVQCSTRKSRSKAVTERFGDCRREELLTVIDSLLNIGCDYAASCDETLYLHLVTVGEMHPYTVEKLNMPSFLGAIHGISLAKKAPNQLILCESCAYKCGTLANSSKATQADLSYAKECQEIFYCHQEIENLENPTEEDKKRIRPCRGWAQDIKGSKS